MRVDHTHIHTYVLHIYIHAKLTVCTKNATGNTIVIKIKEVNSLLPKRAKEKLEIIDIPVGQDTQAQVIFDCYFALIFSP